MPKVLQKIIASFTLSIVFFTSLTTTATAISAGTQVDVKMDASTDAATSDDYIQDMVVAASGDVHIVTRSETTDYLTYIKFDGTNWSSTVVDNDINEGAFATIKVYEDDEDQIGIAWAEYELYGNDTYLYYSYSTDGGDTFSTPEEVHSELLDYEYKKGRPGLLLRTGVLDPRLIACTNDTSNDIYDFHRVEGTSQWYYYDSFLHADVDCKDVRYFKADGTEYAILGPSNSGDDGVDLITRTDGPAAGNNWSVVSSDIIDNITSSTASGQKVEVLVDWGDNINFVISDNESTGQSDTIYFATYNGSSWTTTTAATGIDIAQHQHGVGIDPNGYIWTSYFDPARGDLKIAYYGSGLEGWTTMDANRSTLSIDPTYIHSNYSSAAYNPEDEEIVIVGSWIESVTPSSVTDIDKFILTDLPGWYQFSKTEGGASSDKLGADVAMSTGTDGYNYAIVGMPDTSITPGEAIILKETTDTVFTESTTLVPSGSTNWDQFGTSVDIDGDYAVVGDKAEDTAYVFKRTNDTWSEQAKLVGSTTTSGSEFGISVGISDDIVVVGARYQKEADQDSTAGAIYIFKRDGVSWSEKEVLYGRTYDPWSVSQHAAGGEYFGQSVSVDGDYVAVGAPGYHSASNGGGVFIYRTEDDGETWLDWGPPGGGEIWEDREDLTSPSGHSNASFGYKVDLEGSRLIVGAPFHDYSGTDETGLAFIFNRSGDNDWSHQQTISSLNPTEDYRFGADVAFNPGATKSMVVGYNDSIGHIVSLHSRAGNSWNAIRDEFRLEPNSASSMSQSVNYDQVLGSIGMLSDRAVVGAPLDSSGEGAYYILGEDSSNLQQAGGGEGLPDFKTHVYLITLIFCFALMKGRVDEWEQVNC